MFLLLLLSFLLINSATAKSDENYLLPSFQWIEGHVPNNTQPRLNIRFPDGKWDDFAILKQISGSENDENCIMEGNLFHEDSVKVKVTGKCPLGDTFEIAFTSQRLAFNVLKVTDRKVEPVIRDLAGESLPFSASSSVNSAHVLPIKFPDGGFVLNLKVFYDESFKTKFDEASEYIAGEIVSKAKEAFSLESLLTKIVLNLVDITQIEENIEADSKYMYELGKKYATDPNVNAFVFLADGHEDNERVGGIAFQGTVCSANHTLRVAIVQWSKSLTSTSKTLAHEIGHLLGMKNDFEEREKLVHNRHDLDGRNCTSINGIMDFTKTRQVWSTCSVRDFYNYYKNVTQIATDQKFCLNQNLENQVYSKVLVAYGNNLVTDLADVEIISLLSSETTCQKPQNFPSVNFGGSGGLEFQDKPLICGGEYDRSACHLYEDGTWKSSGSMKQGRNRFAMTKSPFQDGSSILFVTGGYANFGDFMSSSEVLTENGWQVSVPLPVKLSQHCMVTVNSTSVMVIGGWQNDETSGKSFIFNSETNIWTEGPTLIKARNDHICGSVKKNSQTQDRSLIAVGGWNEYLERSVEVLDLDLNTWRNGPEFPLEIYNAEMVEDPSGGVVLIGGRGHRVVYDTLYRLPHAGSDATWELMSQKLKARRHDHTAFLIPDKIAACN